MKWSRARQHYDWQGLFGEDDALQRAELECLDNAEIRARRREREAECRAELDQEYLQRFAQRVRELIPSCPTGREQIIAEHACLKHSGIVGRSAAAKNLEEEAVTLAVNAHIRHAETRYDELLATEGDRTLARMEVNGKVRRVLEE